MHCVERSWINFMDEYIDPSRLEIDVGVLRCPICLSEDGHLKKLVCGHSFHGTCMKLWFSKCLNCPLCRLSFKRETEKLLSKCKTTAKAYFYTVSRSAALHNSAAVQVRRTGAVLQHNTSRSKIPKFFAQ